MLCETVNLSVCRECIPVNHSSVALDITNGWNLHSPHQSSLFPLFCGVYYQKCCEKFGEERAKTMLAGLE